MARSATVSSLFSFYRLFVCFLTYLLIILIIKMDSRLEECPTGILVDFEETTIAISSDSKMECNGDLSGGNAVLLKHGTEEPSLGCQTVFVNGDVYKISSGNCLGAELNSMKDEFFSNIEWRRSPSPTTMNMIAAEASKIVDQLHTTLETTLWEDELSLSLVSEDEYCVDASYKGSSRDKILKVSGNIVEEVSCFKKGNSSNSFNLVVENSQVNVDNYVYEENKNTSQTDLTIDTCVDNENLEPSKQIYTTAKKCTKSSSKNSMKSEKTVSNGKNCVYECTTTTSLNYDLTEENKVCCSVENYSASTEDNSFLSEVESNVITEVSSVVLFNAKNLALTEKSNISHEVKKKCSSAFSVINSIVSSEVDSDSNASTKESNKILKTDSAALTDEINANNDVGGHAANKVECNAPNEDDGNVPNEDDGNVPNEDDGNAPIEDDGNAPIEDDGNTPIEDDGNAPIEDDECSMR
ncbi:hypothetical protein JTE90_015861 [Oedothorax gibbosus]|uniref:Uncharacterized protein n=1 Tax=Oedothorax gibbosus TaxID=931172 RepID=A0AAV6VTN4_9ARAC|nr:hypothetical protein JTE90_015861 [Oedothorax gibbosus]